MLTTSHSSAAFCNALLHLDRVHALTQCAADGYRLPWQLRPMLRRPVYCVKRSPLLCRPFTAPQSTLTSTHHSTQHSTHDQTQRPVSPTLESLLEAHRFAPLRGLHFELSSAPVTVQTPFGPGARGVWVTCLSSDTVMQSSHMTVTLGWGRGGRPLSTYSMMAISALSPFLLGMRRTRV